MAQLYYPEEPSSSVRTNTAVYILAQVFLYIHTQAPPPSPPFWAMAPLYPLLLVQLGPRSGQGLPDSQRSARRPYH